MGMSESSTLSPPRACRSPGVSSRVRAVLTASGVLWGATAAIAALVAAIPQLVRAARDVLGPLGAHPLQRSPVEVFHIAANNALVAGSMLAFAAFAARMGPKTRTVCDVVAVSIVARSAVFVGVALGAHTPALLPYLPHLPLEWAAIGIGAGAWLHARRRSLGGRELAALTVLAAVALIGAAVLETYATPR